MLDSSPFYSPWPPKPWQQQHSPFERLPVRALQIADFTAPAANGVDPKWSGWVYVKVNIWSGECKVGYTDGPLAGRLTETGQPHLALHTAFGMPWSGTHLARAAERHCHNRLGLRNMVPHLMTGESSELYSGPVWHVTELVARAMKEFYDHQFGSGKWGTEVDSMQYVPVYNPDVIKLVSNMNAPYWSWLFNR